MGEEKNNDKKGNSSSLFTFITIFLVNEKKRNKLCKIIFRQAGIRTIHVYFSFIHTYLLNHVKQI